MISVRIGKQREKVSFHDLKVGDFFLYSYTTGGMSLFQKINDEDETNTMRYIGGEIETGYIFEAAEKVERVENITIVVEDN